jgi:SulP family sulfate permease
MESNNAADCWLPTSVLCLRDYSLNKFLHDFVAGITVGLVALPLAMAFAIASGLTPQAGIYCAIVTGFLIFALGGSRTQIGGPTGAFVVVIASIVAVHGVDGLFMCTIMAGVILIVMGLTSMGTAVKFIPRPIIIGFTNGIAILIASTQVKDFLGLKLETVPGVFWLRMEALAKNFHTLSIEAAALGAVTIIIIIVCRAVSNHIPGAIVALVLGTVAVWIFKLPVETIGTRFHGIPRSPPSRDSAPPQYDRTRCHRALRPGRSRAHVESKRSRADSLRSQAAALATHPANGVRGPRRSREYL